MSVKMQNTINQIKVLVFSGVPVLLAQTVNKRGGVDLGTAILGMLAIIVIAIAALKIKELIPLKIPAFAWASLITLILTTPWSPVATILPEITKDIGIGSIGTTILAIAAVSIGSKLNDMKKLSWKIIIVAFVVFIGTYFGSALVAQFILKAQGII